MKFDSIAYLVSVHVASAIIDGDYTGLSDEDTTSLETFVDREHFNNPGGHWSVEDDAPDNWGICEVTGLFAERVLVVHVFPIQE